MNITEPKQNTAEHCINKIDLAKSILLAPYGLEESVLTRTIADIFSYRIDYVDLYFQATRSEAWSLEEKIVKSGSFSIDQGVGVRSISDDHIAFAYSDDMSLDAIRRVSSATKEIASTGSGQRKVQASRLLKSNPSHALYLPADPIKSLDSSSKVKILERIDHIARCRDPRIKQVMATLSGEYNVVLIVRSDGLIAADIRPLVRTSITVVAEQNGRREIGISGGGGRFDYSYFTDDILSQYVDTAVYTALVNLDARPTPAGPMTVVLGPGWPGVLIHEAIGHGLEGDFNRKGSSSFSGRIGQKVAARGVTIVDDGTLPNKRGSLNIDDEGNPTECTTLIEDGILTGYMQDSLNARLMKMSVTGNARRESYSALPMPRMTNTYMLNGDKDPQEIVSSVKNGLYAANFSDGQVDITNGKFVFSACEAYIIENGKITHPVKGAMLIGSGPESLRCISMIGNDMKVDTGMGTCEKKGQSIPISVGQPTLRIDQMIVGGTKA